MNNDDRVGTTLVIIPTFNERENLADIASRVLRSVPDADVLVVDDNSPDGTGALASALASGHDRIHVMHRAGKQGLGAAYRAGFAWGLDHGYERLVEMDADGSHQPEQLHRLLEHLDSSDVVLGSRWVTGGAVENWPLSRAILSRGGSLYARIALGIPVRDITGGYRAFTADALKTIDFDSVESQGYCFQIDMLWRAYKVGLDIVEVPITFVERVHGESKMSSDIMKEAILRVTLWGLRALPGRLSGARRVAVAQSSARSAKALSNQASGDQASGDHASGDQASGAKVSGAKASGDSRTGDSVSPDGSDRAADPDKAAGSDRAADPDKAADPDNAGNPTTSSNPPSSSNPTTSSNTEESISVA